MVLKELGFLLAPPFIEMGRKQVMMDGNVNKSGMVGKLRGS